MEAHSIVGGISAGREESYQKVRTEFQYEF